LNKENDLQFNIRLSSIPPFEKETEEQEKDEDKRDKHKENEKHKAIVIVKPICSFLCCFFKK
jgi:hypothetical protein